MIREWLTDRDGADWPRVLLVSLAVTLALGIGVVAATSSTAFGPYNPSWDGATDLRERVEADPGTESELLRETDRYDDLDANATVAFVIAPDDPYEGEDADRVRRFVERGGTLVVLENFGTSGNALLADVDAQARTDGRLLRDERHHYRGPPMPIATGVENHTYTEGVDRLTLNYATAVDPGNATVLVRTSEYAYLGDEDDELDELDEDDELAAYPVATVEDVGDGRVIVVGDPSVTINAMLDQPDNEAFLRGLAADEERAVFDLSHAGGLPPLAAAALTLRETPLLQVVVGALSIGLVAAVSRRGVGGVGDRLPSGIRNRLPEWVARSDASGPTMSDAERRAFLRRRHPEWDEARIDRVMGALNRSGSKRGDDE